MEHNSVPGFSLDGATLATGPVLLVLSSVLLALVLAVLVPHLFVRKERAIDPPRNPRKVDTATSPVTKAVDAATATTSPDTSFSLDSAEGNELVAELHRLRGEMQKLMAESKLESIPPAPEARLESITSAPETQPEQTPLWPPRALAASASLRDEPALAPDRQPLAPLSLLPTPAVVLPHSDGTDDTRRAGGGHTMSLTEQMDARRRATHRAHHRHSSYNEPAEAVPTTLAHTAAQRASVLRYGALGAHSFSRSLRTSEAPLCPPESGGSSPPGECASDDEGEGSSFGRPSPKSHRRWASSSASSSVAPSVVPSVAPSLVATPTASFRTTPSGSFRTSDSVRGGHRASAATHANVATSGRANSRSAEDSAAGHYDTGDDKGNADSAQSGSVRRRPMSVECVPASSPLPPELTPAEPSPAELLGVTAAAGWGVLERASRDGERNRNNPLNLRKIEAHDTSAN